MTATITIYSRAVSGSDASNGNLYDNVGGGNHSFMVYDPGNGDPRLAFRGQSDGGVPGIGLGGQLETFHGVYSGDSRFATVGDFFNDDELAVLPSHQLASGDAAELLTIWNNVVPAAVAAINDADITYSPVGYNS